MTRLKLSDYNVTTFWSIVIGLRPTRLHKYAPAGSDGSIRTPDEHDAQVELIIGRNPRRLTTPGR